MFPSQLWTRVFKPDYGTVKYYTAEWIQWLLKLHHVSIVLIKETGVSHYHAILYAKFLECLGSQVGLMLKIRAIKTNPPS